MIKSKAFVKLKDCQSSISFGERDCIAVEYLVSLRDAKAPAPHERSSPCILMSLRDAKAPAPHERRSPCILMSLRDAKAPAPLERRSPYILMSLTDAVAQ